MCSVAIAALREQRSNSETQVSAPTSVSITTSTLPLFEEALPIPDWCNGLLDIDESTPLADVARMYLESGMMAGGVIERDLTAAAVLLAGNEEGTGDVGATSTTLGGEEFDAEGRFIEDDAVLRAGQLIDELCKRVSLQAVPADTVPN